ncbi:lipid storage droplets surface-binding protein 2 isoform X2 [Condylostylus longicornis]|uniref:lipid storage droplets surface-binding protein 2 isoform X2 n=1 Tax=Condylostylus longicornis TaxID=2530218 RepID=UPI00244E3D44|nr:lipid storage droplets surface-binding protein 2 isoform X2 [Condylostylus longicornis]
MESESQKNIVNSNAMDTSDSMNLLPHLESLERMMQLPVVGAAWQQSQNVYETVKSHNRMLNWAFRTAEDAVHRAINTAAPIAAPIVSKFDRPIHYVDETLVKGIDKLEVCAPIIKEQPQEIYNQAKNKVIEVVQPICALRVAGQQKAASLKDLSWQKANEVLATQYGSMAVNGVDNTSALAERLLDYYFPKIENETEASDNVPISANDDPVLHTVQTVGRLSNKVARRVYRTVSRQIKELKKEDVQEYVASLIAVLRLTQYLNFINEKMNQQQQQQQQQQSSSSSGPTIASTPINTTSNVQQQQQHQTKKKMNLEKKSRV